MGLPWHCVSCSKSKGNTEACEVLNLPPFVSLHQLYKLFTDDASLEENDNFHERWCNDLASKFLLVFVLDRFGDFVSDQVRGTAVYCWCSVFYSLTIGSRPSSRSSFSNPCVSTPSYATPLCGARTRCPSTDDSTRFRYIFADHFQRHGNR
jgi:hypothetical protein